MEFLSGIAASAHEGGSVTLSTAMIQPIAAEDVADKVVKFALKEPANGIVEIGGPERFSLATLVEDYLKKTNDPVQVIAGENAPYFGARLKELTLIPGDAAELSTLTYEEWFPTRPQRA